MAWVRLDDGFPQHPKLLGAGPLGRELFVAALCHCNRFLTDGRVSMDELRLLGQYDGLFTEGTRTLPGMPEAVRVEDVAETLIRVGAWHYVDGKFVVHDYGDYQALRADTLAQRERWREEKKARRAGLSNSKTRVSAKDSGVGKKENLRDEDVDARTRVCTHCEVGGGLHVVGCPNSKLEGAAA